MKENKSSNGHGKDHEDDGHREGDNKKVIVNVDTNDRKVKPGNYVVSDLKKEVKVDATKELEQVINGQLVPLDDNAIIRIKGGEVFISHIRRGGSS